MPFYVLKGVLSNQKIKKGWKSSFWESAVKIYDVVGNSNASVGAFRITAGGYEVKNTPEHNF